jgi:hypothetical protein
MPWVEAGLEVQVDMACHGGGWDGGSSCCTANGGREETVALVAASAAGQGKQKRQIGGCRA